MVRFLVGVWLVFNQNSKEFLSLGSIFGRLLWALGFGLRALGFGLWALGFGLWSLGSGLWALGSGLQRGGGHRSFAALWINILYVMI